MAQVLTRSTTFAALVRDYAERRGIGVRDLARRIGRDSSSVARVFTGESLGLRVHRAGEARMCDLIINELRIPSRDAIKALVEDYVKARGHQIEIPGLERNGAEMGGSAVTKTRRAAKVKPKRGRFLITHDVAVQSPGTIVPAA